jgi:hypothetical protein
MQLRRAATEALNRPACALGARLLAIVWLAASPALAELSPWSESPYQGSSGGGAGAGHALATGMPQPGGVWLSGIEPITESEPGAERGHALFQIEQLPTGVAPASHAEVYPPDAPPYLEQNPSPEAWSVPPSTPLPNPYQARPARESFLGAIPYQHPEWSWQVLPEGLLYHSYLAGEKESRFASQWLWDQDRGLVWDVTLGGRVGLLRHGTPGPRGNGFQFDLEGAALVRMDPEVYTDVEAVDFRAGLLATWREGPWSAKAGYYHLSSHLGDEYLLKNPSFWRVNYVRDSLIAGLSYDVTPDWRVYGEVGYAIGHQGGAQPLEVQAGAEFTQIWTTHHSGPFAAANLHSREEHDWGTGTNLMTGWQWVGPESGHRFRVGVQYYNGPSLQWSFISHTEQLVGCGLWFDY